MSHPKQEPHMSEIVILLKIYGVDVSESKGLGSSVKLDSNGI